MYDITTILPPGALSKRNACSDEWQSATLNSKKPTAGFFPYEDNSLNLDQEGYNEVEGHPHGTFELGFVSRTLFSRDIRERHWPICMRDGQETFIESVLYLWQRQLVRVVVEGIFDIGRCLHNHNPVLQLSS
jgi:hypothetical protein